MERFGLIIILVAMVVTFASIALVYRRRKGSTAMVSGAEVPMQGIPDAQRSAPELRRTVRRGDRERMIEAYCDVVESSGAQDHMTPREISGYLNGKGIASGSGMIMAFEDGIYAKEATTKPESIVDGLRRLRGWIADRFRGGKA
jgi:hypothetical protein